MGKVGKLDNWLSFQDASVTQNAANEDIVAYVEAAQVWGSVEPLSGREFQRAQSINSNIKYKVRIRTMIGITDDIKATSRFVDLSDSRVYNIEYAEKLRNKADDYTDCFCVLEDT